MKINIKIVVLQKRIKTKSIFIQSLCVLETNENVNSTIFYVVSAMDRKKEIGLNV